MSSFQPKFISWSYRNRGNVARSQTKTNRKTRTFRANQTGGQIHSGR